MSKRGEIIFDQMIEKSSKNEDFCLLMFIKLAKEPMVFFLPHYYLKGEINNDL